MLARLVAEGRGCARSPARTPARRDCAARRGSRCVGDILDRTTLRDAMAGCAVVYHLAGLNGVLPARPLRARPDERDGTVNVVRAAATGRRAARRLHLLRRHDRRAPRRDRPGGHAPSRDRSCRSYERSKWEAEREAFATARDGGVELVSVNPSSVQGPGRTRGTAKLLLGYLNGTLKALIDSRMSVVDIADCAEGHLLAETRGSPRGAVPALGRDADGPRGDRDHGPRRGHRGRPADPAARPRRWRRRRVIGAIGRSRRRRAPFCREMMRTLLHGHAYDGSRATRELGLRLHADRGDPPPHARLVPGSTASSRGPCPGSPLPRRLLGPELHRKPLADPHPDPPDLVRPAGEQHVAW